MACCSKIVTLSAVDTSNQVPVEGTALGDHVFTATEHFNMKIRIMVPSKVHWGT